MAALPGSRYQERRLHRGVNQLDAQPHAVQPVVAGRAGVELNRRAAVELRTG